MVRVATDDIVAAAISVAEIAREPEGFVPDVRTMFLLLDVTEMVTSAAVKVPVFVKESAYTSMLPVPLPALTGPLVIVKVPPGLVASM